LAEVAGIYSEEFSHYEEVTREMKVKVIGEVKANHEEVKTACGKSTI